MRSNIGITNPLARLLSIILWMIVELSAREIWGQTVPMKWIQYYPLQNAEPIQFKYDAEGLKRLQQYHTEQLRLGYFYGYIDTLRVDSILTAKCHNGDRILPYVLFWSLASGSNSTLIQNQLLDSSVVKSWTSIEEAIDGKLTLAENNGYPFLSIAPINILKSSDSTLKVQLQLQLGPLVKYDSLFVSSSQNLPVKYIRRYLGLKQGSLYNESELQLLENRIEEIPFIQKVRTSEVRFWQDKADVKVFVKRKSANYFNAIVGIRPDDRTGQIRLTGDAEIRLLNAFNRGEELELNWRKLQSLTQDLRVAVDVPYWFGGPIGTETSLKIYKRDSTFTDVKGRYGLLFQLERLNRISVFIEQQKINYLRIPLGITNAFQTSRFMLYGFRLRWVNLDYKYNPRSGYEFDIETSAGKRQLTYSGAESVPRSVGVVKYQAMGSYYVPTWSAQTIKVGIITQGLSTSLVDNIEMLRFGGLRTMRGIDEESINATVYGVLSLEYRWLFERNGALYAFWDKGWYEQASTLAYVNDSPQSFGVGVNFETKGGVFTFNYALGQQFDNPIEVRNAKISFGFRNVF